MGCKYSYSWLVSTMNLQVEVWIEWTIYNYIRSVISSQRVRAGLLILDSIYPYTAKPTVGTACRV